MVLDDDILGRGILAPVSLARDFARQEQSTT